MTDLIVAFGVVSVLAILLLIGEIVFGIIRKVRSWKRERAYLKPQTRYFTF